MPEAKIGLGSAYKTAMKIIGAREIAAKSREEEKKGGLFSGIMNVVKPLAGLAMKGLMTVAGIGSGGLLSPLLLALGSTGITKIGSNILKGAGLGADPSKIQADSKYGFGEKEAEVRRESLASVLEEEDPFTGGNIAGSIASSYMSALVPTIGKEGIKGGELTEAMKPGGKKLSLFDLDKKKGVGKFLQGLKRANYPVVEKTELTSAAKAFAKDPRVYSKASALRQKAVEADVFSGTSPTIREDSDPWVRGETTYGNTILDKLEKVDVQPFEPERITGRSTKTPLSSAIDPTKGSDAYYYGPSDVARARGKESTFSQMLETGEAHIDDKVAKTLFGKDVVKSGQPFLPPITPKVPVALEEDFVTMPVGDIQDVSFTEFGEWDEPVSLEEAWLGGGPNISEGLSSEPFGTGEPSLGVPTIEQEDWAKRFMQPEKTPFSFQEGGQVPTESSGGGEMPTISDYFEGKGMSLGGSYKQSLTGMLQKADLR